MNRHFTREDTQMTNNHTKKLLNIMSHWKDANQHQMRLYYASIRMAVIRKTDNNRYWPEWGDTEPSRIAAEI